MSLVKQKTPRSEKYKAYVRTQECCVGRLHGGCDGPMEAHHTSGGGIGMKGSDYHVIPLCRGHHTKSPSSAHQMGKVTFYIHFDIDRWEEVAKCLEGYLTIKEEK